MSSSAIICSKSGLELIYAARWCDTPTVNALLKRGVDVDHKDKFGETALMHAARAGASDIVLLLAGPRGAGADVTCANTSGETALMLAAQRGMTDIVRVLLRRKENPGGRRAYARQTNKFGDSAISLAERFGWGETLRMLENAFDLDMYIRKEAEKAVRLQKEAKVTELIGRAQHQIYGHNFIKRPAYTADVCAKIGKSKLKGYKGKFHFFEAEFWRLVEQAGYKPADYLEWKVVEEVFERYKPSEEDHAEILARLKVEEAAAEAALIVVAASRRASRDG